MADTTRRPLINEDYSLRVGARRATANVAANAVVSAAPATFIVTIIRFNNWALWPVEADPAATATIMTLLTGIPRWVEDFWKVNVLDPRYRAAQQAGDPPEGE